MNLHNLPADVATQIVTRHLLCPLYPHRLRILRVLAMREHKVIGERALQNVRPAFHDGSLQLSIQLNHLGGRTVNLPIELYRHG